MPDIIDRLLTAATMDALAVETEAICRAEGFGAFVYFGVQTVPDGSVTCYPLMENGFPPELNRVYTEQEMWRSDPLPQKVITLGAPVRWSVIVADPDREKLFQGRKVLEEFLQMGDGYSLPAFGPHGRYGLLAVGLPLDDQVMDRANPDRLQMIAQLIRMRVMRLRPSMMTRKNPLSPREREILSWVAKGKSNGVIAEILQLSAATVDTYLRRIYDKLNVTDRTSAVVRAISIGLVNPI